MDGVNDSARGCNLEGSDIRSSGDGDQEKSTLCEAAGG